MAKFTIHSKDGRNARHVGEPQYSGSYMSVDYLEFRSISSPSIIDWEIGDYIDYFRTGKRYKLYSIPMPKKVARVGSYGAAIEYSNVQFFAATKELEIAPFKDLVADDNGIHFSTRPDVSTFEDVHGIARRIEACMNDIFPNRWKINVYESDDEDLNARISEAKEFSVSQGSCLDALSQIYDTWKGVGWIHTTENGQEIITIGRANVRDADNTTDLFTHGIGNGLTSIKKAAANEREFATRLYVYGSNRNLPHRYYNQFNIVDKDSADIQNLMIPIGDWGLTNGIPDPSKAYLQADDSLVEKYGLIPKTVYFDGSQQEEIYPSIVGITEGKVREHMIKSGIIDSPLLPPDSNDRIDKVLSVEFADDKGNKEDMMANPNFHFWVRGVGFDIAEQGKMTSEGHATISMKSGACAGREFVVKKSRIVGYAQELTLERNWDESIGMGFPNRLYPIKQDDQFVLLDIPMPDFYVTINSEELLERGKQLLADYTRVSAYYEPGINAIRMKEVGGVITPGMFMQISDNDIIDTEDHKDYVLIDSISIDEHSDIPTYKITLREQKRSSRTFSVLEEMIEDAKEDTNQAIKRERQYTERRFRSAQETLKMLESAFGNFSKGITPVTVQTMSMLIGDESLQYKFTKSRESLVDVPCPLSWSAETKQMIGVPASLLHMTLDITGVVPAGTRGASDYKSWNIVSWWDKGTFESPFLEDGEKSYYVYVKASKDSADAWFYMDENSHSMIEDDAYYFMVGILNSEYDGNRDFVTLYGYTEVLPGQITTDVIRSADGRTYFDLMQGEIGGTIRFVSSNGEDKSMSDFADEQKAQFSVVDKNVKAAQDAANVANASVSAFNTRLDGFDETIAEINNKLDGIVESYFEPYAPSRTNEPAATWIAEGTEADHVGDTFTNTELTGDNAGKSWRWLEQTDGTYDWQQIADSDAAKALALAAQAQAAADGKTTTFLRTPSNYKVGDIWIVGDDAPQGLSFKKGDILTTSNDSEVYVANHWSKYINYVDEFQSELDGTVANINQAIADAEQAAKGYTDEGKAALQKAINELDSAKAGINDVYTKAQADGKISTAEQAAMDAAQEYADAAQDLAEKTSKAYADGKISEAESRILATAQGYADAAQLAAEQNARSVADGLVNSAEERANKAAEEYADEAQRLAEETAAAYADGKVSEAEANAIAEAEKKVNAAKAELEEAISEVEGIANLANAATSNLDTRISNVETEVNESVAEINARLDGVVENYFEEGVPTTTNKPVTEWKAASEDDDYELINHVGDTYTNIQEYINNDTTPDAGKSWRWCWCNDASITDKIAVTDKEGITRYLHWHPIADSDAVKALLEASKAQTAADGKSKTFVTQPVPPYKEGDLWVQGESGDIYRCKNGVNRASGSFTASDWEKASKYTDDTVANEAKALVESVSKRVDDSEYLRATFEKGSTEIAGGVVMSQMVAVRNNEEKIEAFLNGSDEEDFIDEEHGKLILASGIPEDGENLKERAKEAKTKLYEDGHFETTDGKMEMMRVNSMRGMVSQIYSLGTWGDESDPWYIKEFKKYNGQPNSPDDIILGGDNKQPSPKDIGQNIGIDWGFEPDLSWDVSQIGRKRTFISHKMSSGYEAGFCDLYTPDYNQRPNDTSGLYPPYFYVDGTPRKYLTINANDCIQLYGYGYHTEEDRSRGEFMGWIVTGRTPIFGGVNSYALNGMQEGLRPKIRTITGTARLNRLDHSIMDICPTNHTIKLPENPEIGQVYEVYYAYKDDAEHRVTIDGNGTPMNDPTIEVWGHKDFTTIPCGVHRLVCAYDQHGNKCWWFYKLR